MRPSVKQCRHCEKASGRDTSTENSECVGRQSTALTQITQGSLLAAGYNVITTDGMKGADTALCVGAAGGTDRASES
jgi:hypothetical protein